MSKVQIKGNASGTGIFTIAAPNTNTDYSITLPTSSATLATTSSPTIASPTFTGDVTFDTSTLVIDSTNNRVGIGQTSPDELLHLKVTSGDAQIKFESSANTGYHGLVWKDEVGVQQTEFTYGHADNLQTLNVNGNGFRVYSKQTSSTIAYIGGSGGAGAYNNSYFAGDVGIGTSSPDVKLHVNESSSGSVAFFDATSNPYIFIRNSTASQSELATIGFAPANNVSGVELQAIAEEDFSTTANRSAAFSIRTRKDGNWGDRVYVTGAGNVGIGTTNPAAGLHIKSQGRDFSAGYFWDGYESDNGIGGSGERTHSLILESTSTAGQDIGSSIGFRVKSGDTLDDITVAAIVAAKENSTTSGDSSYDTQSDGYLAFYTNTDYDFSPYYGTKPIERMRIDSSGRVTMPYQPAFSVDLDGYNWTEAYDATVPYGNGTVFLNQGSHFSTSTHRFTAPIAGNYHFSANLSPGNTSSSSDIWQAIRFSKNGSIIATNHYMLGYVTAGTNSNQYDNMAGSVILSLSANDYIEVKFHYNTFSGDATYGHFSGFLLG